MFKSVHHAEGGFKIRSLIRTAKLKIIYAPNQQSTKQQRNTKQLNVTALTMLLRLNGKYTDTCQPEAHSALPSLDCGGGGDYRRDRSLLIASFGRADLGPAKF